MNEIIHGYVVSVILTKFRINANIQLWQQVFLNGSETSETLLQSELYVAKLSLKCRYLFGNFCKFLAPKTKTVNKNIVMKVNFLKKLSI